MSIHVTSPRTDHLPLPVIWEHIILTRVLDRPHDSIPACQYGFHPEIFTSGPWCNGGPAETTWMLYLLTSRRLLRRCGTPNSYTNCPLQVPPLSTSFAATLHINVFWCNFLIISRVQDQRRQGGIPPSFLSSYFLVGVSISPKVQLWGYADDISIIACALDPPMKLENTLNDLNHWDCINTMQLNPEKYLTLVEGSPPHVLALYTNN